MEICDIIPLCCHNFCYDMASVWYSPVATIINVWCTRIIEREQMYSIHIKHINSKFCPPLGPLGHHYWVKVSFYQCLFVREVLAVLRVICNLFIFHLQQLLLDSSLAAPTSTMIIEITTCIHVTLDTVAAGGFLYPWNSQAALWQAWLKKIHVWSVVPWQMFEF